MIDEREMAIFADNLWNNYIKGKVREDNMSDVSFYRAKVTGAYSSGKLPVQRPFDDQSYSVRCPEYMSDSAIGEQVLVIRFGRGNNLANHYIVDDAGMSKRSGAIGCSSGTILRNSNTAAVTLTSGTSMDIVTLTLPKGSWILTAECLFGENSNGARYVGIIKSATSSTTVSSTRVAAAPSGATRIQTTSPVLVTDASGETFALRALQHSGSSLSIIVNGAVIKAIKIT